MNKDAQMNLFEEEKEAQSTNNDLKEEKVKNDQIEENEEINAKEEDKEEHITTKRGEVFTKEEWTSPVIEDGPTRQEVEEWKDKYGSIYFTPFEGLNVFWRTLSRPEYREIVENQNLTMFDKEEIITDKCVLFPRNFSSAEITQKGFAGVPSTLCDMIMSKSGFTAKTAPIKL